jgi:hypothetical protein
MKTSPAARKFLIDLIERLEGAGCNPVLLRNYENFPDEIGNDLDVFISYRALPTAYSIMNAAATRQGGSIAHVHRRGYFVAVWLRFPDCVAPIHIDLYHGALTWHGLRFLSDEELITSATPSDSTMIHKIPRRAHEALVSCLASVLWGGFFKARYQEQLCQLLADTSEVACFTSLLVGKFGHPGQELASAVITERAALTVDQSFARKLRLSLFLKSCLSKPLKGASVWLSHWRAEAACYLFRLPGLALEFDPKHWGAEEILQIRNILDPYFGATHEIEKRPRSIFQSFKLRRLRGKNHLILLTGNRFSINGRTSNATNCGEVTRTSGIAAEALKVLSGRITLQYQR